MKAHFDTPGAPQAESLNTLALGMNRKGAALLFYQTCGILPPMLLSLPAVVLHWWFWLFNMSNLPKFSINKLTEIRRIHCVVLASRDYLRVEQTIPFGDILISRGAKMWHVSTSNLHFPSAVLSFRFMDGVLLLTFCRAFHFAANMHWRMPVLKHFV